MKRKTITASQRVAELVAEHGSIRAAGKAVGMSYPYLWRIGKGLQIPHAGTLAKLGLREVVTYERT